MPPSAEGPGESEEHSDNYYFPMYNDDGEDGPQMVSMTYYIKMPDEPDRAHKEQPFVRILDGY